MPGLELECMHATVHAETDGQVENTMLPAANRLGARGMKMLANVQYSVHPHNTKICI